MAGPQLTQRAAAYEKQLAEMLGHMADQIADGARRRVRRNLKNKTAHSPLVDSFRVEIGFDGALRVLTDKPYARYVEFGTMHQPARPFLTPAVEEVKVTFSGLLARLIDDHKLSERNAP